jgi:hypothetical protein
MQAAFGVDVINDIRSLPEASFAGGEAGHSELALSEVEWVQKTGNPFRQNRVIAGLWTP